MAKKRAHSIMRRYTVIERKIICKAIGGSGKDDEIVATCGTDTVQRASMHTLQPKNWVSDEVIHFYYKLLAQRDRHLWKTNPTHEETYFGKSFFFTKMMSPKNATDSNSMTTIVDVDNIVVDVDVDVDNIVVDVDVDVDVDDDNDNDDDDDEHLCVDLTNDDVGIDNFTMEGGTMADGELGGTYEYANIRNWFNGKDIFKFNKIIFPINIDNMHWIVAVIFMKKRRIQIYDSMGYNRVDYTRLLYRYVHDEHLDKKGYALPDAKLWELNSSQQNTPLQDNGK